MNCTTCNHAPEDHHPKFGACLFADCDCECYAPQDPAVELVSSALVLGTKVQDLDLVG